MPNNQKATKKNHLRLLAIQKIYNKVNAHVCGHLNNDISRQFKITVKEKPHFFGIKILFYPRPAAICLQSSFLINSFLSFFAFFFLFFVSFVKNKFKIEKKHKNIAKKKTSRNFFLSNYSDDG